MLYNFLLGKLIAFSSKSLIYKIGFISWTILSIFLLEMIEETFNESFFLNKMEIGSIGLILIITSFLLKTHLLCCITPFTFFLVKKSITNKKKHDRHNKQIDSNISDIGYA